jgi:uncharacterized protein (DUF1697 family)
MPALRELFVATGFDDVRTYLQSGNVVLTSGASAEQLATQCEQRIAERFGLEVEVVVRTRDELAEVVRRNPLGDLAVNPKRYQVSFLASELDPGMLAELQALTAPPEQFAAIGRELYAWHPDGVARSRLSARLAGKDIGVTATARNWTTVTNLLLLADEA